MTHTSLIIDDDASSVEVLAQLLEEVGLLPRTFLNANKLVEALDETIFDLIFVDLEMPDKSGFEVLEIIRQYSDYDAIPIIAYSVHVSEANEARRRGFHSFLSKPLKQDRFAMQVQNILDGKAVWDV